MINKNICFITARKGSRGIKNKNLRKINGKELILHTFDFAKTLRKKFFIHVSTDSKKIYNLAKEYNFFIDELRPKRLSGPFVETIDVIKYELNKHKRNKINFTNALLLQPTVPFRDKKKIFRALRLIKSRNYNSVISISRILSNHPYRMKIFSGKFLKNFCNFKKENMIPRQKLPKVYIRSGSFYLTKVKNIFKENSLVGRKCFGIEVFGKETINIDSKFDLYLANNFRKLKLFNC